MNARRLHRLLGIVLLLPLCAWVATAAIFFLKPGYAGAYEMLFVRTLPFTTIPSGPLPAQTSEVRLLRTTLGNHLLIRTADGWSHRDPSTSHVRPIPSPADIRALIEDAIRGNPRYGNIISVSGLTARTSTGVEITLDWHTLSLQQHGTDTDRIDLIYRIHYLQWTGIKSVDRVLGGAGLVLLFSLTLLGIRLLFRRG